MNKTAENIKKVALIFFVILGLGHLVSGLMVANGYLLPLSFMVHRILDIPFAMTALIYGLSSIRSKGQSEEKTLDIVVVIFALLIFGGLVYINLFLPNKVIPTS